jgi:hypothetical protein
MMFSLDPDAVLENRRKSDEPARSSPKSILAGRMEPMILPIFQAYLSILKVCLSFVIYR